MATKAKAAKKAKPEPAVGTPAVRARLSDSLRQRYDAAQTTDENSRHWANADTLGPESSLDPGVRRTLRSRARYEVANDTYAQGMISTLANDTIGTGPALQLVNTSRESAKFVENEVWRWMTATRLPQKLRTMRRAKCCDGESFSSFFTNPRLRVPVRLDLRLHEAEMIASPVWGIDGPSLSDGVIFDDFGNVTAYTLLRAHPGERVVIGANDWETVPAADMIHLFNADRPSQSRGAPEITAALPLFAIRRRYSLAVLRAAEIAALHSGVIQTQANPEDPDDVEPLDAIDLERGSFTTLPKGWTLSQLKAEQPTAVYEQFTKAIIREIARCLSMPLNIAACDSSGYNYSSGRMDHQIYFGAIKVERSYFESHALDPILSRWWAEARLIPDYLPPELRDLREPPAHVWRWDGVLAVDPQKEAEAEATKLASGTTHRAASYAAAGKDVDDEDELAARSFGLTVAEYRRALATKILAINTPQPAQASPAVPSGQTTEDSDPSDLEDLDNE